MHSVYAHCFEVSAELQEANYLHEVFEQTLETPTLLNSQFYAFVVTSKMSHVEGNLLLNPSSEVESVIEDIQVCRTLLDVSQKLLQIIYVCEVVAVESTDLSNCVNVPRLS